MIKLASTLNPMDKPEFYLAACDSCGQHLEFPIDGVGLTVPCPHCNQDTVLTQLALAEPSVITDEITAGELKEALSGAVECPRVSISDWRLRIIVWCAHLAIWLSRLVLSLLLRIGSAASCFLSRQMEYHADACAVAVTGSAGLESLLLRLREQSVLHSIAFKQLNQYWKKQHKLPDSLPDFLAHLESCQSPDFPEQARLTLLNETASWFATHPTPAQRVQHARKLGIDGLFTIERPARLLFGNFEQTAREVTALYYRQDLQLAVTDPMLKPVADFFPSS